LTEEDIWPKWFKRWLDRHPQVKGTFTITRMRGDETTILQANSQSVGGKRAIMCERCNTKRLGRLQDRASVVLKPMLEYPFDKPAAPIVLTETDQRVLAAWATMTAMTAGFLPLPMPDVDETYFTQAERVAFRKKREPFKGMLVTTSQYFGKNATGAYFSHSAPHILHPDTGERTGKTAALYVVTLVMFTVCFQVAFYRKPSLWFSRRGSISLAIGADPEGAAIQLWPRGGVTTEQEWPPKYVIGDDTFLLYCRRWEPQDESQPEPVEHPDPGVG
jgi:hypothetical protein